MLLFAVIIIVVSEVHVVVSSPQQCYYYVRDYYNSMSWSRTQTCATSQGSLGTSHCGTAEVRYLRSYSTWYSHVYTTMVKGCFDCTDKSAACFALAGLLKSSLGWVVQQCNINCCNTTNCNANTTILDLSQNAAIDTLRKDAFGTTNCYECDESDNDTCILNQQSQSCRTSGTALGITHCSSAKVRTRNVLTGAVDVSFIRGCIDCEDKKSACSLLAGSFKFRKYATMLECDIECCNGSYCNDGAADLSKCFHCTEGDGSSCFIRQQRQICSLDPDSLGTTHCGSAVGRKRNQNGVIQNYFYRGCFNCSKKREACFTLGGYWKGNVNAPGATTILECELQCCDLNVINGSYCNVETPILKPAAVTVFTPTVTGPAQCNVCLEENETSCSENQQIQVCGTDLYSLGTTHCGSAVGRYRESKGDMVYGFFRGCINCADKMAACAAVGGFRKNVQKWTQLQCEIECCTEDNCNTHIPSLVKANSAASREIHLLFRCTFVALVIAFAGFIVY